MTRVGELEEPVFAGALADLLPLDDVVANHVDATPDELLNELRLETEEQMQEVGEAGGISQVKRRKLCVLGG